MNRYICIHGHFYQPPRENAWLEEVEKQDSAYPYHDWNERITAECYSPNAAARLLDGGGKIVDIVSNYSKISFNFGPTLLFWMERHMPELHRALVEADKQSQQYFSGHGSAIAQVYNHMIMPLANLRDKRTQVIWGIKDFERRFGRRPEGMWLAETAVDLETLETLAEHHITFTILAPRQAGRVRRRGGRRWRDVSNSRVDPKTAYLCKLPSGRTISLFFYDGPISQDVAFGGLLVSGERFASRLTGAFVDDQERPQLVHMATDGETYGHHHRFGDMALAYCLHHIESNGLARITVYGEYLEKFPPTHEVEIIENSSWSCSHGIERWRENCGCNSGREGWTQHWRSPLRAALDWLRDNLAPIYEQQASEYLRDPWKARDDYIDVILDRAVENVEWFYSRHATRVLSREEQVRVFRLLEMQRNAMLMYTSCGWFFDEISGLETTQVLQYSARAIQLAEKICGATLDPAFTELIARAPSNVPDNANGAQVYERFVKPAIVDLMRVGAHYGVSSLFEDYGDETTIYSYKATRERYELREAGRQKLAIGKAHLRSNITSAEDTISFAVLHLGDHNLIGGVRQFVSDEAFNEMSQQIQEAFSRSDIPEIIRVIDKHFETHNYNLFHLFRDEQRRVFGYILESTLQEVEGSFRRIYDHHYPILQVMRDLRTPLPKALLTTAEFTVETDLRRAIGNGSLDLDHLRQLVQEARRWSFEMDKTTMGFVASRKINTLIQAFAEKPEDVAPLGVALGLLETLAPLGLSLDISNSQNLLFSVGRPVHTVMKGRALSGDEQATAWVERFENLGDYLKVRIA